MSWFLYFTLNVMSLQYCYKTNKTLFLLNFLKYIHINIEETNGSGNRWEVHIEKKYIFFPGVVNGFFKYQKPSYTGHSFPASELLLKH